MSQHDIDPAPAKRFRPWWRRRWAVGATVALIILIAVGSTMGGHKNSPRSAAATAPAVHTSSHPTPTASVSPSTPRRTASATPDSTVDLTNACTSFQRQQFDNVVGTLKPDVKSFNQTAAAGDAPTIIDAAGSLYNEVATFPEILANYRFSGNTGSELPTLTRDANAYAATLDQINGDQPSQITASVLGSARQQATSLLNDVMTFRPLITSDRC